MICGYISCFATGLWPDSFAVVIWKLHNKITVISTIASCSIDISARHTRNIHNYSPWKSKFFKILSLRNPINCADWDFKYSNFVLSIFSKESRLQVCVVWYILIVYYLAEFKIHPRRLTLDQDAKVVMYYGIWNAVIQRKIYRHFVNPIDHLSFGRLFPQRTNVWGASGQSATASTYLPHPYEYNSEHRYMYMRISYQCTCMHSHVYCARTWCFCSQFYMSHIVFLFNRVPQ